MKRYPESHLETIDPSWIAAVEKMIKRGKNKHGEYWCPPGQEGLVFGRRYNCEHCITCNVAFGHGINEPCPFSKLNGCENAIKEALNLIAQWKKWAGIE